MENVYLATVLAPLIAAIVAGLFGRQVGRAGAHWVTILGVGISFVLSLVALKHIAFDGGAVYNETVYQWMVSDGISFEVGFLVDKLTVMMMTVVTFVSLMVHIYTIGYMHEDPGYQRFFSYISLFTFSMLMLVMSNNFLQLFFGWEAVGVVSYLLIGFWYKKPTAIFANMKAFLVNRVGDFGFLLGIAGVLYYTGSLDYMEVFAQAEGIAANTMEIIPGYEWAAMSVIGILLFVGAMGKSAQVPLHVWLPDSMEGPTPISALIHAATMVTAGIFMVARMSPLYELSETALAFILVIGAVTAFFMGLLGIVANDIKRVIAYSTLSQLGYMTVALGASAYAAGVFHLMTHAFFKALLFLAAGSVIIGMHHEQDMRKMGGLKKYMPITYWTSLVGTLALIGFPFFSGFYSKDALIEAVHASELGLAADIAYWAVLSGVFVTALYSFRLFFMTFHGEEKFDKGHHVPHESPLVVTVPLVLLAIPSIVIGYFTIGPMLFGGWFGDAITVSAGHDVLAKVGEAFHGPVAFVEHAFHGPAVYLMFAGVITAAVFWLFKPEWPAKVQSKFNWLYKLFVNKYYADDFNQVVFAGGARKIGQFFWRVGDSAIIDGFFVNGSARVVGFFAGVLKQVQTGYLYTYAFAMIIGLCALLGWLLLA
ncbi:MAG: NADH-quinone oxidoreductase subunit L [Gammaproteobacteria bacterium]|nr:NADH-quinone oxidoreductase subunit L [Gammaproteobacteria bacterium]